MHQPKKKYQFNLSEIPNISPNSVKTKKIKIERREEITEYWQSEYQLQVL